MLDRIFLGISRANNVLLLVLLLAVGAWLGSMVIASSVRHQRPEIALLNPGGPGPDGSAEEQSLYLYDGGKVAGAGTRIFQLGTRNETGKLGSGSGYHPRNRNLMFLRDADGSTSWLFPTNQNLIMDFSQLPREAEFGSASTKALLVSYIAADTNGDGSLDDQDSFSIAFVKPDGTGFVNVLDNVKHVVMSDLTGSDAVVLYQTGAELLLARVSLDDFKLMETKPIASVVTTP